MSNGSSDTPATVAAKPASANTARWTWHPFLTIIFAVSVFLATQILGVILVSGVVGLLAGATGWPNAYPMEWLDGNIGQFMTIFVAETLLVLAVIYTCRRTGVGLRWLGFSRPRKRDAYLPVLAYVAYYGLVIIAALVLGQLIPGIDNGQEQDIGFDQVAGFGQLALVFIALVVCAPVAEEVLFRGLLFGGLRQRWSFPVAALVTSVIFGAAHLAGGTQGFSALLWMAAVDTLILSLVLCYLREKTGRLWAPILLHAVKNGTAFMLIFVFHLTP